MNPEQFVLIIHYNHTRNYLFASDIQICIGICDIQICIGICLDDIPFTFVKEQYKTYKPCNLPINYAPISFVQYNICDAL